MMSVLRVNVGPLPDNLLWSEPVQGSSGLASFSLRRLADIQRLITPHHNSNVLVAEAVLLLLQRRYGCVSSAKAFRVTPCLAASFERSAVYKMKSSGPNNDPCGTKHLMVLVVDVISVYTTQKFLPFRYDLNKDNASLLIPKPR